MSGTELASGGAEYLCSKCGRQVTSERDRFPLNGEREHTFRSPHGYTHLIGYFRTAPGCGISGERTAEYSWFAGHLYAFAMCAECDNQLGWVYFKDDTLQFFGLELGQLREVKTPG